MAELTSPDYVYVAASTYDTAAQSGSRSQPGRSILILSDGNITLTTMHGASTGSMAVKAGMQLPGYVKAVTAATCNYILYW